MHLRDFAPCLPLWGRCPAGAERAALKTQKSSPSLGVSGRERKKGPRLFSGVERTAAFELW